MILRGANPADVPALSRLASEAFIAKFGHLYSAENLDAFLTESLSEAAILAELADPTRLYQLAADESGALLGFAKIGLTCGFPDQARGNRVMELKQLYTAPDATGQGIGALLMDWAMDQFAARGSDEVQISVYAENHGAHRFYARYGFEKVADITFRVGDHIDPEFLFARML
ncbi:MULTISPECIES: GNAT family N-acetyltransferase [unclassified Novosphingobium]|uniref:GNAT family N-acetyltransferase n=1 Tax=unclassified Novosphingobium TaxID=2644732 RepID=UPI000EECAB34|nr:MULTISPECIES: GNAT family N-acetyltransferase [unclassified Novosphingobium]HCF24042.1 GNAT family N-acetyltransferase [Novosphingobium sp.]HQV04447.1 GNAT family N-acetyltransferase [Novosphingobium sp.]